MRGEHPSSSRQAWNESKLGLLSPEQIDKLLSYNQRVNGILLVDKPSGWTSFDVVAKVRNLLRKWSIEQGTGNKKPKVGHTGTLDPLATGLLVLLLGDYTKKATELSKLDKTYEVTIWLGKTSTTGDEEGEKLAVSERVPAHEELEAALRKFKGEIEQTPPAYSAIKISGQRAYKLARAGKEVKLEPRKVNIYSLELLDYTYPEVKFVAKVSSGTYIRSLAEDIGKNLGTGAYMSALCRTHIGRYFIAQAIDGSSMSLDLINKNVQDLD
jgi:tRNA pseudouridine55 synthase